MKSYPQVLLLLICLTEVNAQSSIAGKWRTVDDNSGKTRSIVEITERQGKLFGKVIKLFSQPGEDPDPVCDKCALDDPRRNRKVIGMEILVNMSREDDEYGGGNILDPEVGKVYRCKIWLEAEELKVRGYVGPFFRTQTWKRLIP